MAYQQKPNSGTAFKSTNKKSERSPDYTGDLNVVAPGVHRISMWHGKIKDKYDVLNIKVSLKEERPQQQAANKEGMPF